MKLRAFSDIALLKYTYVSEVCTASIIIIIISSLMKGAGGTHL
jgi:hypothetical protein